MQLQPNQIKVAGTPVMVKGLKGDYHVQKHQLKQAKCPFDAGMDLYLSRSTPESTSEGDTTIFTCHTDVHLVPIAGVFGIIHERSSTFVKLSGARVRSGIIDPGYSGEILVQITCNNLFEGNTRERLKRMADHELAIAQIIFIPFLYPVFVAYDVRNVELLKRGTGGFGHTDLK